VTMVSLVKEKLSKYQKDVIPTSSHKIDLLHDFMKNRSVKTSISDFKFSQQKKCFINACAYCAEQSIE
jgi:hypothetical protein